MLPAPPRPRRSALLGVAFVAAAVTTGCKTRPPKVPGETDIAVQAVRLAPPEGAAPLTLDFTKLLPRLGMRPATLLANGRTFSDFRVAEDRRRIEAYWRTFGYLDVAVEDGVVTFDGGERVAPTSARVAFTVREGVRYRVGPVAVIGAADEDLARLRGKIPFAEGGADVDLERFRHVRHAMEADLRARGFAHAMVYSRFYVDRAAKTVGVAYFVDRGPPTTVASVVVEGAVKIPAAAVLARAGLREGVRWDEAVRAQVERDLLDTGAFSAVFVRDDADTVFIVPGTAPDSGGELREPTAEKPYTPTVDGAGNFVPRKGLPTGLHLTVRVVEAPRRTVRLRGSAQIDPTRVDAFTGGTAWLRGVFGPFGHLVVEGRVGRGAFLGRAPASRGDPSGLYGDALLRSVHSGVFGRTGDLRVTARYKGDLHPGSYVQRLELGPGARTTLAEGLFVDADLLAVASWTSGYGPFLPDDRARLRLPGDGASRGIVASGAVRWDARNEPVEATAGHLLALRARYAPGGPLGTHRFVEVAPEGRLFVPLSTKSSLALRGAGAFLLAPSGDGVPAFARLFGGGAYGVRAYGQDGLSPYAPRCADTGDPRCAPIPVGGLSLVEGGAELRYLPPREPIGAALFADVGGASATLNPFADGVTAAVGAGLRLRLWYLPAAVDVAWAPLRAGQVPGWSDGPVRVFFRVGEAF